MEKHAQHLFRIGLSASGFLAVLSLFLVFDSVERNEPLLQQELNGLYGALLLFVLSVTVAWIMFFGKWIR